MSGRGALLVLVMLTAAARAEDGTDVEPDFEPDFEGEQLEASAWRPLGELLLRADRVTGLPGGRDDLERIRARARVGAVWQRDALAFGIAVEAGQGSDANRDNLANNDVEQSDRVGLDQAWLRWQASEAASLQLGKFPLPLELSPLLWDDDLRPVGASLRASGSVGDFDRWQMDLGAFEPDPLGERGPRLLAVQLGWHLREGAALSGGVQAAYLDYDDLDAFARAGLGRGNSLQAQRYRDDFRLLDLQFYLRARAFDKPLEARVDLVRNLAATRDDRGTRASLVLGDRFAEPGWELGWAWQRIQRDAVLAGVNADDWWFHTAARGHMPWIGYGFDATWSLRLAAFRETRDGLDERTDRVLVDVEARW